jgi:hypothetical protein
VVIAALGGANMLMTGVIGLYVGRIYAEAKGRPLYIVERAVGFDDAAPSARRPARARARREKRMPVFARRRAKPRNLEPFAVRRYRRGL